MCIRDRKILSFLPSNLGIITSDAGTVIHDFRSSLDVAEFQFKLFWYKSRVQGSEAATDLKKGISYFSARDDIDAILIFRGGGSQADLSVFNNYELAKNICTSSKPIFSAIGHQEDQCSVQDVSFRSFGVPKDIGRFFADLIIDKRQVVANNIDIVISMSSDNVDTASKNLSHLSERIFSYGFQAFSTKKELLGVFIESIPTSANRFLQFTHQSLEPAILPALKLAVQKVRFSSEQTMAVVEKLLSASSNFIESRSKEVENYSCLLYTSPSPRDATLSRMPSSA